MAARRAVPLACAALALLLGIVAATLQSAPYGHRVSALVHLSTADPLAAQAVRDHPGFALVPPGSHYDGAYFYAIARDPLALGTAHRLIDDAPYRYGHAGLGLLAAVVSAGRAGAVPGALLGLTLLGLALAAWAGAGLARGLGRSPWGGLVVALSPGLLYAVANDTSEPVSAALLGLGLLAWQRGHPRLAALAFVPMCLTKEPLVLVPVLLAAWHVLRHRHRPGLLGDCAALAAGPVLFAGWLAYLADRFGQSPIGAGQDRLQRPVRGWVDSLRTAASFVNGDANTSQVGAAALPLVLALLAALLIGLLVALRLRTALDVAYVGAAAVALALSPLSVLYPKDLMRTTVIPVLLLPAVWATSRRCCPGLSGSAGLPEEAGGT